MTMFRWNDESVAMLGDLWARGLPFSEIAHQIGIKYNCNPSRSTMIGKAHRLGLKRDTVSTPIGKRAGGVSKKRHAWQATIVPAKGAPAYEPEANASALPADMVPIAQRKRLLDLGPDDCRFPYGDVGAPEFFFCGAPKACGSYCMFHARVAFRRALPVSDEERERRRAHGRAIARIANGSTKTAWA